MTELCTAARSVLSRAIVGLLVLLILVSPPWSSHHAADGGRAMGMTTVDPARFTYDVPTISRSGLPSDRAAEASRTQLRLVRFGLGPQSIEAGSASPTSNGPFVATEFAPSGSQYSVAFEMDLKPVDFGRGREVHFNRANRALDDAFAADPSFAASMEEMIPGVRDAVSATGGRSTPTGWTWHHAPTQTAGRPGVMQLVPTPQHAPGWWVRRVGNSERRSKELGVRRCSRLRIEMDPWRRGSSGKFLACLMNCLIRRSSIQTLL